MTEVSTVITPTLHWQQETTGVSLIGENFSPTTSTVCVHFSRLLAVI